MRVCIVGASGKLGQYMVQQALDRGYEVVGVCREQSVGKLGAFKGRITVIPGATSDPEVIKRAVAGCDGVLVVLVPRGVHGYSTRTAQAVLDHAPPGVDPLALFCIGLTPQVPRRPGRTSSVVTPSLLRIALDPLSPTFVTNSYPFVG
jgi:NAD(P)-dependent dehydrogenase (short-subunit alcohol dehydrogenase family)